VYWGTSSVDRYMPGPHAVIKARDFEGPKELAAYLKQVRDSWKIAFAQSYILIDCESPDLCVTGASTHVRTHLKYTRGPWIETFLVRHVPCADLQSVAPCALRWRATARCTRATSSGRRHPHPPRSSHRYIHIVFVNIIYIYTFICIHFMYVQHTCTLESPLESGTSGARF
jgi:hypothetical protein